jgi:FAD/FMN-containing dehydrogenase
VVNRKEEIRLIEQLQSTFRGPIVGAGDAEYDTVRRVYNGMIDKRPRMIARCADVADVIAAVQYGRENNLLTAIRGGGHNGGGGNFGVVTSFLFRLLRRRKRPTS